MIEILTFVAGLSLAAYVARVLLGRWKPGQQQLCWLHRYDTVRDTGITVYERCRHCGKRDMRRRGRHGPFQPVDRKWLATGEWTVMRPPGKNGRVVATKPRCEGGCSHRVRH